MFAADRSTPLSFKTNRDGFAMRKAAKNRDTGNVVQLGRCVRIGAESAAPRPSPADCTVIHLPATMTELERSAAAVIAVKIEPREFMAQLLGLAWERHYSPGWCGPCVQGQIRSLAERS